MPDNPAPAPKPAVNPVPAPAPAPVAPVAPVTPPVAPPAIHPGQPLEFADSIPGPPAPGGNPFPAPAPAAPADPNSKPTDAFGSEFVKINWKNKIGGHEKDGEWCEIRRAQNLVASGHAEIVEEKDEKKK